MPSSVMRKPKAYRDLLLATSGQSQEADRMTIEDLGIPGQTLMEIAGNRAADIIRAENPSGSRILLVCGKGNNAGDALVIGRILLNEGFHIAIYPVLGTDGLSEDAERNYRRLQHLAAAMNLEIPIWNKWDGSWPADLIIDGIFGTGLQKPVRSPISEVVYQINHSGKPVIALDLPSGIHCDSGTVLGQAVKAHMTLQFGIRKLGCYIGNGPAHCGNRRLLHLPFPDIYMNKISIRLMDESLDGQKLLAPPALRSSDNTIPIPHTANRDLHKYSNGVVHVIGGAPGLTGAPLYSAKAAWSLGMGAVTLIHPSKWLQAMDVQAPELIKVPLGREGAEFFSDQDSEAVLNHISSKKGVTIIGPGIGRKEETMAFVRTVIRRSQGPLIVDADGLQALADDTECLRKREDPESVILTPHPGELSRLTSHQASDDAERLEQTVALANELGCTLISKGTPVFVHSAKDRQTLISGYDATLFARAGFGDILAGQVAAFFARSKKPLQSAEHGLVFGYQKMSKLVAGHTLFPEPSDFT